MLQKQTHLAIAVLAVLTAACSSGNNSNTATSQITPSDGVLRAVVRRTSSGVPHIKADDLMSAAFGSGYTQAQDNICLIAETIIKARGERSLFFGEGEGSTNIISDFSYRALAESEDTASTVAALSAQSKALLGGFVAGYNRYLADTPASELPAACRDQPWVRSISMNDLYDYYRIIAQYASGDIFTNGVVLAAVPPGVSPRPSIVSDESQALGGDREFDLELDNHKAAMQYEPQSSMGSNAWGIGGTMTEQGRGALLANPHFPYSGTRRFYQSHISVPGLYDVNGAGLLGVPIPLIGFNRNIAWSHTVSTARRFTLYELTLAEGEEPAYVKDGVVIPFRVKTIRVDVAMPDQTTMTLEREIYFSDYGPMVAADILTDGALPTWGQDNTAYTYRDANQFSSGMLNTWMGIGKAANLEQFQAVFKGCGSTLWANTVYADDAGNAFYIDSSSVPYLSDESRSMLETKIANSDSYSQLFYSGLTLLDGSSSRDDWIEGECKGLVPYAQKPTLLRDDYVQNSNSSHWQANPNEPLTGYSPLYGDEEFPVNARTQLGIRMLNTVTDSGLAEQSPAGQDGKFDARDLLDVIWSNRSLYAELYLGELRERCQLAGETPINYPAGLSRSVAPGCAALRRWNGTYDIQSTGAHLFRVLLAQLFSRNDLDVQEVFDPAKPADTYLTFSEVGRGSADDQVLQSLAKSMDILDQAGIAYDATLGSVQRWTPSGGVPPMSISSQEQPQYLSDPIPWHGGSGWPDGVFNAVGVSHSTVAEDTLYPRRISVILPDTGGLSIVPGEGWAVGRGTSWHFGLEFTDNGPEAVGLLSYSQSTDPESAHFVDQSQAYSQKQPRKLLFSDEEIELNTISEVVLTGQVPSPSQ